MFDRDASIAVRLFFLAALAYVVFPVDAVPDVIPIVGWLDDIGFFGVASGFVFRKLDPYKEAALNEGAIETTGVEVQRPSSP